MKIIVIGQATATVILVTQVCASAQAESLSELIPGLYGGDGIFLSDAVDPGCVAQGLPPEVCTHEAHFTVNSAAQNVQLNDSIAESIRPFPVTPSAGGITYTFNPDTGEYTQSSELLGPIVSERAQTLGKDKFSFNLSVTRFSYDEFQGTSLNDITADALHQTNVIPPPDSAQLFENDVIRIRFDVDLDYLTMAFSGTYGITDRLDLNAIVPIVRADLDVKSEAEIITSDQTPNPDVHQFVNNENRFDSAEGSATGLGDIILGAKYQVLDETDYDLTAGGRIKLETGDEDDFLGTGSTTITPFVAASWNLSDFAALNSNFGVEFDTSDSDRSAVQYSLGVYGGNSTVTGSVDLLGRHRFDGDEDILDAAVGIKWRPAENIIFSANVLTGLNDDGLRSDFVGTLGFEYRN